MRGFKAANTKRDREKNVTREFSIIKTLRKISPRGNFEERGGRESKTADINSRKKTVNFHNRVRNEEGVNKEDKEEKGET